MAGTVAAAIAHAQLVLSLGVALFGQLLPLGSLHCQDIEFSVGCFLGLFRFTAKVTAAAQQQGGH